jgi:hypothetical protein
MRQLNLLLFAALLLPGCTTKTLEPGGPFMGDKFLYDAEKTINGAYAAMDAFLRWEHENRSLLAPAIRPKVKSAADKIRINGQNWINTAHHYRDIYVALPSAENRMNFAAKLKIIQDALTEAAKWMEENQ